MRQSSKRAAAIVVDRALAITAPLLVRARATADLPRAPRVLLVRCDHIGDAVMATPVIRPLRDTLQASRLDVLAGPWSEAIFSGHPAIDEVITYATPWWLAARGADAVTRRRAWTKLPHLIRTLRQHRYDIAIDLRGDLRHIAFFLAGSGAAVRVSSDRTGGRDLLTHIWSYNDDLHEVEKDVAVVGTIGAAPSAPALDVVFPHELSPELTATLQAAAGPRGLMALSLRAREPARAWPAEHAARLIDGAREQLGLGTVLVGGPDDRAFGETVAGHARTPFANVAGRTDLLTSIAVFAKARAAVIVESGPMHLAACTPVPIIALFGPSRPEQVGPWSPHVRVVSSGKPCGCLHPICDYTAGPGRCFAEITPQRVLAALADVATASDERVHFPSDRA